MELGVAVLACQRARAADLDPLRELIEAMDTQIEEFPAYRQSDVRFHIGLAEATGSGRLVASMTEVQGAMTDLISYIAHPPEVLAWSNAQHAQLLQAVRAGDLARGMYWVTKQDAMVVRSALDVPGSNGSQYVSTLTAVMR